METRRPATLFFDVNETLLDLSPLKRAVSKLLNGDMALVNLWFTTLLQYSLLATVTDTYEDFGKIGKACLQMVAESNDIPLSEADALSAIDKIKQIHAHAEVPAALKILKEANFKLVALSNSGTATLQKQLKFAGLHQYFDRIISVEEVQLYKPHRAVYAYAAQEMTTAAADCMLIAAHSWDIIGANQAGWQTAFVARAGQVIYPLAKQPDIVKSSLAEIAAALLNH